MQYIIEYEEIVSRINEITIEVKDEDDAEGIVSTLSGICSDFTHPDDILFELEDMGVKVIEFHEGAENCEYEIL